jgi:exonuclease SbcC
VVTTVPKRRKPKGLADAERACDRARRLVEQARAAERTAERAQAAAAAAAADARDRCAELDARVAAHPDLAIVVEALAEIGALDADLTAARKEAAGARKREDRARKEVGDLDAKVGRLRTDFHAQRDPLGELERPPLCDDVAVDWPALEAWADEQRPRLAAEAEAAAEAAAATQAARAAALAALREQARAAGVEVGAAELDALYAAIIDAGHSAAARRQEIAAAIDRADKLRDAIDDARREHAVAKLLADHLRRDRFEQWLAAEAIERLVVGASETLRRLSGGNYSLTVDDRATFLVVDHRNADETRPARTLSGGETFQASLALALALADQLGEVANAGGNKLEAIFLDEGFGTLDAETLETVASTVETLGSSGRMVGIVTHVPGLAERVPVRFRVAPGDRGATITREEL